MSTQAEISAAEVEAEARRLFDSVYPQRIYGMTLEKNKQRWRDLAREVLELKRQAAGRAAGRKARRK